MTAAPLSAQWRALLAALACGEARPGEAHQRRALADVLGELQALRQEPPPQVVVVIDGVSALAEQACGSLGAELARRLEKGRSAGVAPAVVGSQPTATWITDGPAGHTSPSPARVPGRAIKPGKRTGEGK